MSLVNAKSLQILNYYNRPFSIDYRERGSYARSVYPTQDTSRMGTAMAKEEE